MKVKELIDKLRDEDQEAEALVLTTTKTGITTCLDVLRVEGKSRDWGGVVVLAEMDNEGGC